MIKIVFMGTPEFAAVSLEKLISAGYDIPLVVTQPDKKGNRNKIIPSAVKSLAESNGLRVAQPARIKKDPEFIEELRNIGPDMIVVAAFGQILPQEVLDIPRLGCINVHGSLLPKLRGASPMQTAILEGMDVSGVTIMRMDAGLDTGDMISSAECRISGMDITEVSEKLAQTGAELLLETIPHIADGTANYEKQDDAASTYAKMISKRDGMTDFSESAGEIERKIRAYAEWPTCYSYLDGQQVRFYDAEVIDKDADCGYGKVCATDKKSFTVSCGKGCLRILELQLQGKKRMNAGDFLRGHKLSEGEQFRGKED